MTVTVAIEIDSPTPPFEQLRQQLDGQIRAGHLLPGDRLPTVRQLSGDLGIAKNTVVRAYRALERDGLVTGERRRGTIVAERIPDATQREAEITAAARQYVRDVRAQGGSVNEAVAAVQVAFNTVDGDPA
ncbi:MAG: GntR family transcriptional regulator [Actinomycetota bacterium]